MSPWSPSLNRVNERLSGEKLSHRVFPGRSKVRSRTRVTPSRISIVPDWATAMNLLHGDHTAVSLPQSRWRTVVTADSHEIGIPRTTLAKGREYGLYSLYTIDIRGDRGSAE